MHSADSSKNLQLFGEEIWSQMQASFASKGRQRAVFAGFVFFSRFSWVDDPCNIDCNGAIFHDTVHFSSAMGSYTFKGARFLKRAVFDEFRYGSIDFSSCVFEAEAQFIHCRTGATFQGARFEKKAVFDSCRFAGTVSFRGAIFMDDVSFSGTEFEPSKAGSAGDNDTPGIGDFSDAIFDKAERVRWFRVNRRTEQQGLRVRFRNCRVEPMTFVDVHWHKHRDRLVLQDELDLSYHTYPEGDEYYYLKTEHELVAVAYRQLATAFERSRDYDLADGCIAGVWEMKRRDLSLKRWNRVTIDLYRLASSYGNDFTRALLVLLALVFLVFPVLYLCPLAHVVVRTDASAIEPVVSAHRHSVFERPWRHSLLAVLDVTKTGLIAGRRVLLFSIESVTFPRYPSYIANGFYGRVVAAFESVIVAGQAALFLLALRRRFRH